ncbi:MAG: hypothetical protein AAFR47_23570, partial [Pseudomonadota bacterium]
MTTVITRFFDDLAELNSAQQELIHNRMLPPHIVRTYDDPDGLVEALTSAGVKPQTAEAYRDRMGQGGAVLLVRADYTPLGVKRITRETLSASGAVDFGYLPEEAKVAFVPGTRAGILRGVLPGGPLMMTRRRDPSSTNYYMANWPIPLIRKRGPYIGSVFPPHARMANWPIGLLLPGSIRYGRFPFDLLVPGQKYMAKYPFAHIVPGHKFMAKFPFGHIVPGHKYMAKFPFAHIVPGHKFMAKFPFGHLVPGGRRMANWPFPLLINGKKHTNSLLPGHKFMAKFPFAHIVPGHKF